MWAQCDFILCLSVKSGQIRYVFYLTIPSFITELVKTIFWKRISQFWYKLAHMLCGPWHEAIISSPLPCPFPYSSPGLIPPLPFAHPLTHPFLFPCLPLPVSFFPTPPQIQVRDLGVRRSKVSCHRNMSQKSLSVRNLKKCPTAFNLTWQAHNTINAHCVATAGVQKVNGRGHVGPKINLEAWLRHHGLAEEAWQRHCSCHLCCWVAFLVHNIHYFPFC